MVLSLLKHGLLFGLLTISFCASARPLILNINASSNNGSQIGAELGRQIQQALPDVASQYDNYLAFLLSPPQFKQLLERANALKAAIAPDYRAEVDAIAVAWQLNAIDKLGDGKLSVNEFWLLQFLPDLTDINKGPGFAATNHDTHNPIAARNVDWQNNPALLKLQAISIYHYEDRTLVNIGFAGLAGVINGFNDQGLFGSVLDASEQQISPATDSADSGGFELRTVLKTQYKIEPASHALTEKRYARNLEFLLANQENIAVLEQPLDSASGLRKPTSEITNEMTWHRDGQLAAVNCFVLNSSPRNCYNTLDYYRWGRLEQLSKQLPEQNLSVAHVITIMLDKANIRQAIFTANTVQSIIFTPKDRSLYLYTKTANNPSNPQPIFEKYQFIKMDTSTTSQLIDIGLLILGVGILAATWVYVFRGDKGKTP